MGKSVLVTPLYVSVAWTLMISYQLFTQTAVETITTYVSAASPSIGTWLAIRADTLIFIYAFAWVFVLSSVIPSAILGKERSVLVQFLVCLTLTFVAFVVQDTLLIFGGRPIDQVSSLASLFYNPSLATVYLLMPYLFMLFLDIRSRKKHRKHKALPVENTEDRETMEIQENKANQESQENKNTLDA